MHNNLIFILIVGLTITAIYITNIVYPHRKKLGYVRRVKNLKPKLNENEYLNIILVDLDGVIAELAFTDKQIMNASIKMSRNSEDSML